VAAAALPTVAAKPELATATEEASRRQPGVEVEIGIGKSGRRAYGFDDIAIVPSRRTRDPEDIDVIWELDAFHFDLPFMAAAMDGVTSPATAIRMGELGGLACLNLEGLWTRYEDPESLFEEILSLEPDKATRRLQEIYAEPIKEELIGARIQEIKSAGVTTCASLTPQRVERYAKLVLDAELDVLVIQGTVVSAEHVSKTTEPLNLKKFIREFDLPIIVGGCASYSTALHLMRTGAVGILVGVGPGHQCTTRGVLGVGVPQATAIADAAGARIRHLDETGVYVHVIADGGMRTGGDIAKAIACGADAVMLGTTLAGAYEAPGRGFNWGMSTFHPDLPRGTRVHAGQRGTLDEILIGPAHENDGTLNLFGALRTSMATTGYESVKEFQKAEVMVAPALQTEGKSLQRSQGVGMGH
jgi:IMP dehydrogenase